MRPYTFALYFFLFLALFSCSSDLEEVPDTISPKVTFLIAGIPEAVGDGSVLVGSQIVVKVEAVDAGGIALIQAFIDDDPVGEVNILPYSISLDLTSYTSKTSGSEEFIDYSLKVVATDIAGNTAITEQNIKIDNTMPSVTGVSLKEGEVLSGNINSLNFNALDEDGLSSVSIYINENVSTTITDGNYEWNLDTSVLKDGENDLKIVAVDVAGNKGIYTVHFIADNTGPGIEVLTLKQEQLLSEPTRLDPIVDDLYSEVVSVGIYVGDELVHSSENGSDMLYTFDPETFPTGSTKIKIVSVDSMGNASERQWSVTITRLLLKLTIPDGYLSRNIPSNHFVFASQLDGSLIVMKEIIFETREVKLYAPDEFDIEKDFTITFASLGRNGVASYLVSVSHVNRQNFRELNLTVPKRYSGTTDNHYPINGFSGATQLYSVGRDYYFSSSGAGDILIQDFVPSNHSIETGPMYIYGYNPLNNFYNYQFVDRPIDPNFEMNFADFRVDNLLEKQMTTIPADYMKNARSLDLYGYLNQEGLENDLFHQIWSYGYAQDISTPLDYKLNTRFSSYAHDLVIGNYQSRGAGLPPEVAAIPDWSMDYTYQNNTVSLTKSGVGHRVGELYLEGGYDVNIPYTWDMFFDSNKDADIVLPNIPEALQGYPLYNLYQQANLELERVGLRTYEDQNAYNDFLDFVIKPEKAFQRSAPRYESIFSGTHQAFPNSGYFYNWW